MRNLSRDLLPLALAAGLIAIAAYAPVRAQDKAATAALRPEAELSLPVSGAEGRAEHAVRFARHGDEMMDGDQARLVLN